jgi:hypothetical protein
MTHPHEELTMTASISYRLAAAVAVGTAFVLLFGIVALGVIGSGGRPDLMYLGVLAVGVVGAVAARFRARGMALALAATALATLVAALIAIAAGMHHNEGASIGEILRLSGFFAALFAGSAWLFRRSADEAR